MMNFDLNDFLILFGSDPKETEDAGLEFIKRDETGFELKLYLNMYDRRIKLDLRHRDVQNRIVSLKITNIKKITVFVDKSIGEGFSIECFEDINDITVYLGPSIQINVANDEI